MSAANSDCLNVPSRTSLCGRAISLQGFKLMAYSLKIQSVLFALVARIVGGLDNGMPRTDQLVVGACFFGPLLALAQCVQVIGQLADGFAFFRHLGQKLACGGFAVVVQAADHLVASFPYWGAIVFGG